MSEEQKPQKPLTKAEIEAYAAKVLVKQAALTAEQAAAAVTANPGKAKELCDLGRAGDLPGVHAHLSSGWHTGAAS